MKKYIAIALLIFITLFINTQANAQEVNAYAISIENRMGKITWLFANSAESSVIFFNEFKNLYKDSGEFYEYNLNDPTEVEEMFIELFDGLYDEFFNCYNNPEEDSTVTGNIEDDQITNFRLYVLSTGFSFPSIDVNFIFIHNTVNDNYVLFCDIRN